MEKAIEIKRRAQRCIQNGDLDGALNEYEKLVQAEDSDPYNFVLLADLQFKRGDADQAVQRYLAAVGSYEKAGLYKNAIAVCKKMMRLSLAPAKVLERLAALHALDGLGTEAALYYMQYAETLVRDGKPAGAAGALQKAFDASPDEVKALERMSEAWVLADDTAQAARAMGAAAYAYERLGRLDQVERCRKRAEQLHAGTMSGMVAERGALRGIVEEPLAPAGNLELDAGSDLGGNPYHEDAPQPAEPARIEGLVTPMAPERSAMHVSGAGLELERVPSGVLGPTDRGAPPRLEVPEPGTNGEPEAVAETRGRGGPPPLPVDANHAAGDDEASGGAPETAEFALADNAADDAEGTDHEFAIGDARDETAAPVFEVEETEEPAPLFEIDAEAEPEAFVVDESAMAPEVAESFVTTSAEGDGEPQAGPGPATAEPGSPQLTIVEIEGLLSGAQERFRTGDREGAAALLVDAALAYERAERLDNAASIFRSLARGPQASPRLLELWLANCERRNDGREAAEVECELGDRSLNDGEMSTARGWFERACEHDPDNAVARRRLSRLAELNAPARPPAPVAAAPAPAPVREPEPEPVSNVAPAFEPELAAEASGEGRVEMSVGRAEAVSFDLGALLSEFQRGIEAQLSGDAQSHYDLAMTYREMGLHAQAVDGFRLAAADPAFAHRAAEMIGRCLLDQGRFEEAVHELSEALRSPKLPTEAVLGLRYQLGLAHEAAGDLAGALAEFERVFEQQANYSDVALKIRTLRTSLGQA